MVLVMSRAHDFISQFELLCECVCVSHARMYCHTRASLAIFYSYFLAARSFIHSHACLRVFFIIIIFSLFCVCVNVFSPYILGLNGISFGSDVFVVNVSVFRCRIQPLEFWNFASSTSRPNLRSHD